MVWFVPHLRAIAQTTAAKKISLFAKSRSLADQLLQHENFVEEFIWIDHLQSREQPLMSAWRMARELKKHNFSHVWILHHSPRYAIAATLAGIRVRVGYGVRGLQRGFLTNKRCLHPSFRQKSCIERGDAFLSLHGIDIKNRDLSLDPTALTEARSRFSNLPKPWIGFGIGSSEQRKCWPLEYFADLAVRIDPHGEFTIFLCGAQHDAAAAREIAALAGQKGKTPVLMVDRPLNQSMALISQCSLFIGNDSGLMNIAASLGVETVGLFGCGVVLNYRQNLHAVTPKNGAVPSMDKISVDQVLDFIESERLKPSSHPRLRPKLDPVG